MMCRAQDVVLVPSAVRSPVALREFIGFDELSAAHPHHELVVYWNRVDLKATFAAVFRIHKSVIREKGWPVFIDIDTRVFAPEAAKAD